MTAGDVLVTTVITSQDEESQYCAPLATVLHFNSRADRDRLDAAIDDMSREITGQPVHATQIGPSDDAWTAADKSYSQMVQFTCDFLREYGFTVLGPDYMTSIPYICTTLN